MHFEVIIQPEAIEDTDNAYDWYEVQQEGLGKAFLEELALFYKKLEQNPEIFSWANKNYREAILQRFPYVIMYEIVESTVYVYAVFHTSRNPNININRSSH